MASTFVLDSRVRTLTILLPALGIAVWIASEVASEEFIAPLLVMIGFVTLVVFSVFVQSVRFETAILNLLLIGYLVGNRGFADITVAKPFYPGEVCLVIISVALVARYVFTREWLDLSGGLAVTVLIYLALGVIRLALDYQNYRLDAVRDSAMVYYAVYFFFGRQMKGDESRQLLEKCLKFSFLALVPIALAQRFAPDLFLNQGGMGIFFQKDDLLTTFAAVGVFVLYTRPHIYRMRWLRVALILFYIVFVVNGITRASLVGLMFGSILLLIAGKKKFYAYPAVALGLGLTVLAGFAVGFGESNTTDLDALEDKLYSIIDVSGEHKYNSDIGKLKSDNNEFRRKLWQSFEEETVEAAPTFGRGFGYDFLVRFNGGESDANGLRSAHNFYVTLFGRMGVLGSLSFLAVTFAVIRGGILAAMAVRRGQQDLADLAFWCGAWAILMASVFGVVLEGPVGAIVFWTFLGIGVRAGQNAAEPDRHADVFVDVVAPEYALRPRAATSAFARSRA